MILPSFSCGRGKTSSGRGQLMGGRDSLCDSLSIPPDGAPNFCHLMGWRANFFYVVDSVHKSGRGFVKGAGRWLWHKMLNVKHRLTWCNYSFKNAMILPSFSCGRGKTSSGRGQLMSGRDTLGDSLSIPPGGAPNFCHLMRRCANFSNVVDSVHKSGRSFVKGAGRWV